MLTRISGEDILQQRPFIWNAVIKINHAPMCIYLIVYDMYTRACSNLSVIIICIWYANCTTILAKSLTEYKNICSGKVNDLVLQSNDIVGNHHHNFSLQELFLRIEAGIHLSVCRQGNLI